MNARIQKWGNSLAVSIPKAMASEVGLAEKAPVELLLDEGRIVVIPRPAKRVRLDQLLAKITPENMHREVDTGNPMGNESW